MLNINPKITKKQTAQIKFQLKTGQAPYEHDFKVTEIRFLFEQIGLCEEWISEKALKMGRKGEHKVPDGLFIRNEKGIAIEFELKRKKAESYRRIFEVYERESTIRYIFYICDNLSLMRTIMKLVGRAKCSKPYCFILYSDLMHFREEAIFRTLKGKFQLKNLLS